MSPRRCAARGRDDTGALRGVLASDFRVAVRSKDIGAGVAGSAVVPPESWVTIAEGLTDVAEIIVPVLP